MVYINLKIMYLSFLYQDNILINYQNIILYHFLIIILINHKFLYKDYH